MDCHEKRAYGVLDAANELEDELERHSLEKVLIQRECGVNSHMGEPGGRADSS